MFEQINNGSLYDEKIRLKQLRVEDDELMRKLNGNDAIDETHFEDGGRSTNLGMAGIDKDVRTTEGDDFSYEEATNCRLREETNASMIFGLNKNTVPVRLNQIQLAMKDGSSGKKNQNVKATPSKVAPFDN